MKAVIYVICFLAIANFFFTLVHKNWVKDWGIAVAPNKELQDYATQEGKSYT